MRAFFELIDALGERETVAVADYEARIPAATRAAIAIAGLVQRVSSHDAAHGGLVRVMPAAIARALTSLYGIEASSAVDVEPEPSDASVALGVQTRDEGDRDVFWIRRPEASAVKALLFERERGARATTLLVPTTRGLPDDWATRWNGAHVEIDILAENVVVRGGVIALAPRLRVVRLAAGASSSIPLATPVTRGSRTT